MSKRTRMKKLQAAVDKVMPLRRPPSRYLEEEFVGNFESWAADEGRGEDPEVIELATRYRAEMKRALASKNPPYYPPDDFLPDEEIEMVRSHMWDADAKFPELAALQTRIYRMMPIGQVLFREPRPKDEANLRSINEFFDAIRKRGEAQLRGTKYAVAPR